MNRDPVTEKSYSTGASESGYPPRLEMEMIPLVEDESDPSKSSYEGLSVEAIRLNEVDSGKEDESWTNSIINSQGMTGNSSVFTASSSSSVTSSASSTNYISSEYESLKQQVRDAARILVSTASHNISPSVYLETVSDVIELLVDGREDLICAGSPHVQSKLKKLAVFLNKLTPNTSNFRCVGTQTICLGMGTKDKNAVESARESNIYSTETSNACQDEPSPIKNLNHFEPAAGETSMEDCEFTCDICHTSVVIYNADMGLSLDLHRQEASHQLALMAVEQETHPATSSSDLKSVANGQNSIPRPNDSNIAFPEKEVTPLKLRKEELEIIRKAENVLVTSKYITCTVCKLRTNSPTSMFQHLKGKKHAERARMLPLVTKKPAEAFPCHICKKTFPLQISHLQHMASHESQQSAYEIECKPCFRKFFSNFAYLQHVKTDNHKVLANKALKSTEALNEGTSNFKEGNIMNKGDHKVQEIKALDLPIASVECDRTDTKGYCKAEVKQTLNPGEVSNKCDPRHGEDREIIKEKGKETLNLTGVSKDCNPKLEEGKVEASKQVLHNDRIFSYVVPDPVQELPKPASGKRKPFPQSTRRPHKNFKESNSTWICVIGNSTMPGLEVFYSFFSQFGELVTLCVAKHEARVQFRDSATVKFILSDHHEVRLNGQLMRVIYDDTFDMSSLSGADKVDLRLHPSGVNMIRNETSFVHICYRLNEEAKFAEKENSKVLSVCQMLKKLLVSRFPHCKAYPFGSRAVGIANRNSDVDIFFDVGDNYHGGTAMVDQKIICQIVYDKLAKSKDCKRVEKVASARVAIVKFIHKEMNLACDVSFRCGLGDSNTKLLKYMINLDNRVLQLLLVTKEWLRRCMIPAGKRGMTSYTLSLMVIFYLQCLTPGILPSVALLQETAPVNKVLMIEDWNCTVPILEERKTPIPNKEKDEKLLKGFFMFYGSFDFKENVVCPLLGKVVKRDVFKNLQLDSVHPRLSAFLRLCKNGKVPEFQVMKPMCVQDPLELSHNVAKSKSEYLLTLHWCKPVKDLGCWHI